MAETWVINEIPAISNDIKENITFTSNNNNYTWFYIDFMQEGPFINTAIYYNNTGQTGGSVYLGLDEGELVNTWTDQAYRTVEFETSPTGELLTWLQANAVKQVTGYSITYHSNGGTPEPENLDSQTNLPNPLPVVSKDNMAFSGWYLDSEFTTQAVAGQEINADTDLYAKFEYATLTDLFTGIADAIRTKKGTEDEIVATDFPSEIESISGGGGIEGGYNITLKVDGNDWQVLSITAGNSIALPTNPIKSGYVFTGWSLTDGGEVINFPYTPSGDVTLYAVFNTVIQLKASPTGYGNSTPTTSFSPNANLDNWTPEIVTKDGDDFVKIPTMYRKVGTISSNQITSFTISSWKEDNDFVPYPCFVDESGNVLPYILIGKYMTNSSSSMVSKGTPGQASGKASVTIGNARTMARNRGTGYMLYDWQIHKLWQDLICAKYKTININSGSGITTDKLGVEWENSGGWVDGVVKDETTWVVCDKPSKYVDTATSSTTDYNAISYAAPSTSNEISKLGYDSNKPFFNFPSEVVSNSNYNTYYCDQYYYSSGNRPVYCNVGNTCADYGAFFCNAYNDWSTTLGARLCFRPL